MLTAFRSMLRSDDGATLVEYSLVVALIAGVAIVVLTNLGKSVTGLFKTVQGSVDTASATVGQ